MSKKKKRHKKILADKLDHIAIKLGEIYAELMKTRYRQKTKPSARTYTRHRKHKRNHED
jgi:hypothetical protein